LKKKITKKRTSGMAQGVGPEFKPQPHKKERKKESAAIMSTSPGWFEMLLRNFRNFL
jgi:hypothetical protein